MRSCVHVRASGEMFSSKSRSASPASIPTSKGASISTSCLRSWNTTEALYPFDKSILTNDAGPGDASSSTCDILGHNLRMSSREARRVRTVSMRGTVSSFAAAIGIAVYPFHDRRRNGDDLAIPEVQWTDTLGAIAPIRKLWWRAAIRRHTCPELDTVFSLRKWPRVCVNPSESDAVALTAADEPAGAHPLVDVSTLETMERSIFVGSSCVW